MKIKCLWCNKEIEKGQKTQKFCSRECKDKYRHNHLIEKECLYCGKKFQGNINTLYCSKDCRDSGYQHNYKKTMIERYGVDNPLKSQLIIDKIKKTNIKKYGVENISQSEGIRKKREQTMLERFNAKSVFGNKQIQEKIKQTNLKKLGVEYPGQSEIIKEKIRQTNLKNHGTTTIFATEEFKKKNIQTNMERYGVPYFCMTEKCINSSKKISSNNLKFGEILEKKGIKVDCYEFSIEGYNYDIKVGDALIEIDPYPWHNSTWHPKGEPTEKNYHKDKTIVALKNGYKCIHVFDWDSQEKIVNLLLPKQTIYARNCIVKEIDKDEANSFINLYHLQGALRHKKTTIYLGLYYDEELVMIMSFGKPRHKTECQAELLRLCTHKDYRIIGGASKIFKYYIENYKPSSIVSYCDKSKFTGEIYEQLGFKFIRWNSPSKHRFNTYNNGAKEHILWSELNERGFDQLLGKYFGTYGHGTNNEELIRQHGYVEIYDCGQATYIWKHNFN